MASAAVRVLRAVGIVVCVIACVSFLLFAVNQTSTASGHQQEQLAEKTTVTHASHKSGFRNTVDEVSEAVSAPVEGLSSSEWGERTLRLLFVLLVFGFVLGYIARVVRVRV